MGNANGNAMAVGQKQKQRFSVALQTDTYQNLIKNTLKEGNYEKKKWIYFS